MTNDEKVMAKLELYKARVKAGETLAMLVRDGAAQPFISLADEIINHGKDLRKEIDSLIEWK